LVSSISLSAGAAPAVATPVLGVDTAAGVAAGVEGTAAAVGTLTAAGVAAGVGVIAATGGTLAGVAGVAATIVIVAVFAPPIAYDGSGVRVNTAASGLAPVEFAFAVMARVAEVAPAAMVTDTGMSPSGRR
jgi:hypothetical protein